MPGLDGTDVLAHDRCEHGEQGAGMSPQIGSGVQTIYTIQTSLLSPVPPTAGPVEQIWLRRPHPQACRLTAMMQCPQG